jgi:hypothetical protein
MSVIYKVGIGFNVPEIDMLTIDPQPLCPGIRATRRTFAATGRVIDEGLYTYYLWNVLEGVDMFSNLMITYFDLGTGATIFGETSSEVTVIVRNQLYLPLRVNARAVLPQLGKNSDWTNFRPRNNLLLLKDIKNAT